MGDSAPARRWGKRALLGLSWIPTVVATLWAFGAVWFDFPVLGSVLAWAYLLGVGTAVALVRGQWTKLGSAFAMFVVVLAWWLTQQPSGDRAWQPDVAQVAWAEVDGDIVTLHNVRNFDYRSETDYTPRWETRTVRLSQIVGIDLMITTWGSEWIAHPIASFQFADAEPICFSIETRKEVGEHYSALGGLYRQYELIYIVADERDVIRLRTNYRKGEAVHLYRTIGAAEGARERFLEYIAALNELSDHPRWYNALTTNCTTSIRRQHPTGERIPWDWRIIANGKADEMLYERGLIATGGLSFAKLKEAALVNGAARTADESPDFWKLIRQGIPGSDSTTSIQTGGSIP